VKEKINNKGNYKEILLLQDSALKAAEDAIVITNVKGIIEWINPAFTKLTGYDSRESIGKSTKFLKSNKHTTKFYRSLWDTILSGKVWKGKIFNKKKNGEVYTENQSITPIKDSKGKILHFIAIKQDITERQKLEEESDKSRKLLQKKNTELVNSKKELLKTMKNLEKVKHEIEIEKSKAEAILQSLGEGVLAIDKNKNLLLMNKKAEEILGLKITEVKGKKSITTLPLYDTLNQPIPMDKHPSYLPLKTGQVISNSKYILIRRDKARVPIALTVSPIKDSNENIIGAVDVLRDVTKESEIDKEKSEFVSLVSHQLRTPLGLMKWYLEVIMAEKFFKKLPEKVQDYFQEINKNNERLLVLVRDLLSVSKIDEGRVRDDPIMVNLIELLKEVIKEMKVLAIEKNIAIDFKASNGIPNILIDAMRFQEVVKNLISNSIKYNSKNGKVLVKLRAKNKKITIDIIDDGIGISKEDKKKLFTKFFRAENAIKNDPEGSGLGLYVAKQYVELWKGKITVKSKEAVGSTFSIILPF
jgi:PAS domain S-box-containing protein